MCLVSNIYIIHYLIVIFLFQKKNHIQQRVMMFNLGNFRVYPTISYPSLTKSSSFFFFLKKKMLLFRLTIVYGMNGIYFSCQVFDTFLF
ncbi:hypothetical protein F4703DRAFT_1565402 [Phycomyces blakesleeanus]